MIFESKHQARADIKGKVLQAFLAILLVGIITTLATYTIELINPFPTPTPVIGENFWEQADAYSPEYLPGTIVSLISSLALSFLFVSVLSIGLNNFFIRNGQGKELDIMSSLFMGFKTRYTFILKTFLAVLLIAAVYILPIYALLVAGLLIAVTMPTLAALLSLLILVALVFAIIKLLDYVFVMYILADEEVQFDDPKEYLEASKRMIKGYKLEFVLLGFTFILWMIASVFTFFLLLIWLLPYITQSYANFYLKIKPKPKSIDTESTSETLISE
jgi:uncharacterized membrane protein